MDTGLVYLLTAFLTGMAAGGVYGWKKKEVLGSAASFPHFFRHFGIAFAAFTVVTGIAWTVLFGWSIAVLFCLMVALYCAGPCFITGSALGSAIRLARENHNANV